MLHIILTILKIIGILSAVLLALILFCIVLALFVPVRYRIDGSKDESRIFIKAQVYWLFKLFRIKAAYPEPGQITVKIFCFTLYDSKKEPKPRKEKKKKTVEKRKSEGNDKRTEEKEKPEKQKEPEKQIENGESEKPAATEEENHNSQKREEAEEAEESKLQKIISIIKEIIGKILKALQNIKYTIRRLCDKIKEVRENINYYTEVFEEEETKAAFALCREQLYRIWKNIRPSKCSARLKLGTGEPDVTGYILAIHGMLYPLIGNNVIIEPDFENQILEGTFTIKGRVTAFVMLRAAIKIYFDKNIRYFLKRFKREEIRHVRE